MKVLIVTPARRGSLAGNRVTALRAAGFIRGLGHRVQVATAYRGQPSDMLLALHAERSADAVAEFRRRHPHAPLVVMLTGTDLYRPAGLSRASLSSLHLADRAVTINLRGSDDLPTEFRSKARAILQSVPPPRTLPPKYRRDFGVCVSAHLRAEKDPLLAARAARLLPAASRVLVRHVGGALSPEYAAQATAEAAANARYRWLGEVPRWRARQVLARSALLVVSSRSEGGAHVVGEAVVAAVPILATRIPGNLGLLGEGYGGYFPVGDAPALAALLRRAEQDVGFLQRLQRQIAMLAERFAPAREAAAWAGLFRELI
ncbi:MAG: TIGR04348 family glycosyltransferase [Candidatus Lambdaproteobacteria bacterium]|nr:TIGR04348 family glycosyltransferase [Candidatus Lambdaproteobacteria bacterium]